MGHVFAKLGIQSMAGGPAQSFRLLVDTGATFSWIDGRLLRKLGVKATRKRRFQTIRGATVSRSVGDAVYVFDGEAAAAPVVFAAQKDANVFGVVTLESLGLEVDPSRGKVRKSRYLLAL